MEKELGLFLSAISAPGRSSKRNAVKLKRESELCFAETFAARNCGGCWSCGRIAESHTHTRADCERRATEAREPPRGTIEVMEFDNDSEIVSEHEY